MQSADSREFRCRKADPKLYSQNNLQMSIHRQESAHSHGLLASHEGNHHE